MDNGGMYKAPYQEYFGPMSGPIQDGMIHFSRNMPGAPGEGFSSSMSRYGGPAGQEPKAEMPTNGRWQYLGPDLEQFGIRAADQNPINPNMQGAWKWVEDKAPVAAAPAEEMVKKPVERFPEGDIYNDWDYFQKRARADVEGINRMPFTYADYPNVGQTKQDAFNQFYPNAWQTNGLQPVIGPNGQNIAPSLSEDVYKLFRDKGVDTATARDWPSLVESLMKSGRIDGGMSQTLLDLAKPKKLDTSFQSSGLLGMMGG